MKEIFATLFFQSQLLSKRYRSTLVALLVYPLFLLQPAHSLAMPVLPETPMQFFVQDVAPTQLMSFVSVTAVHHPDFKPVPDLESNNLVDGEIPTTVAIGFFQDRSSISQKLHPRFLQAFHPPLLRPPRLSA